MQIVEEKNILFYENEAYKSSNPPLLYSSGMVSPEEYSDFLLRLRGIEDLVSVLAKRHNLSEKNVFVGVGSDDVLAMCGEHPSLLDDVRKYLEKENDKE